MKEDRRHEFARIAEDVSWQVLLTTESMPDGRELSYMITTEIEAALGRRAVDQQRGALAQLPLAITAHLDSEDIEANGAISLARRYDHLLTVFKLLNCTITQYTSSSIVRLAGGGAPIAYRVVNKTGRLSKRWRVDCVALLNYLKKLDGDTND